MWSTGALITVRLALISVVITVLSRLVLAIMPVASCAILITVFVAQVPVQLGMLPGV